MRNPLNVLFPKDLFPPPTINPMKGSNPSETNVPVKESSHRKKLTNLIAKIPKLSGRQEVEYADIGG